MSLYYRIRNWLRGLGLRILPDARHAQWALQRRMRGFDDRELWSLDISMARWLLPRLKALVEGPRDDLKKEMQEVLEALRMVATEKLVLPDKEEREKVVKAMHKLADYFFALWY